MPDDYEIELLFTDEHGNTITETIGRGTHLLGRSSDCEIMFSAENTDISRHHARLTVTDESTVIEDLDSSSGVMVNGRIGHSAELEQGDVIRVGSWNIQVSLPKRERTTGRQTRVPESAPEDAATAEELKADLEEVRTGTEAVLSEMAKRIVGQERVVRLVWATILARGHCLLIGVPGLAKTYMVTTFSEVLGVTSNRIQFTPDLMPMDIIGSHVMEETEDGKRVFKFVQGPVFTQLLLADEINRTPPKTQSALLEAMQERQVTVANKTYNLPAPFCVIASQNPIEQEGTYPLPEAQLDRFLLSLDMDYPERDNEVGILLETTRGRIPKVDAVLSYEKILRFQNIVDGIAVGEELGYMVADLVRSTRPGEENPHEEVGDVVDWGAGPRAGQAIIRAAKALAAMDGRPGISQEDVLDVAVSAVKHRIGFNFRARTGEMTKDRLIEVLAEKARWI